MPRPANVTRAILNGHMQGGEEFHWGVWLNNVPADEADAQLWAQVVVGEFTSSALSALAGFLMPDSGYDSATVYGYPTPGLPAAVVGTYAVTGGVGTSTNPELPEQCCFVVTTRTGFPGRSRRGRMYIPVNSATLTDHQLTSVVAGSALSAVSDFLEGLNQSGTIDTRAVVMSETLGNTSFITEVTADSRLDIQRRRANREAVLSTHTEPVAA